MNLSTIYLDYLVMLNIKAIFNINDYSRINYLTILYKLAVEYIYINNIQQLTNYL